MLNSVVYTNKKADVKRKDSTLYKKITKKFKNSLFYPNNCLFFAEDN